jgi:hypothetical protein
MAVTYVAAGAASSGTASVSVAWPSGHATNDIGILVLESAAGVWSTPSGWTFLTNVSATGTQLVLYWRRATSSAMANVSTGFPTGADHVVAKIYVFRGCTTTSSPIVLATTATKNTASTSWSAPSVTTTVANQFLVWAVTRDDDNASTTSFSNPTNANLVSPTEAEEAGTTSGNGGGFTVGYGIKTTAGSTGTTTGTVTSSTNASATFGLAEPLSYQLDVTAASFALNATSTGLLCSFLLNNTLQTYVLGSSNLILSPTVALNITVGAFVLTGNSLDLTYTPVTGLELICQLGTFTWTGISSILGKQVVLNNTTGSFILNSNSLNSALTYAIIGNTRSFLIGFNPADVAKNFQLISSTGTYTLTGFSNDAVKNYPIVALPQSYLVGTTGIDYFSTRRLEASSVPFVMTLQSNGDFFWYQTTQTIPIIKPRLTNRNQWILGRATHMGRRGL